MSISKAEHDELCCVYAGEITAEKLNKIIKASGNTVVSYYPEFFASYLKGADINSMLVAQPTAAPAGAAPAEHKDDKKDNKKGKKEEKKPKKKEKKEEEGGFMDMFG